MNKKMIIAGVAPIQMALMNFAIAAPLDGYVPSDVEKVCNISPIEFSNDWVRISLPIDQGVSVGPFFDEDSGIVYIFPADGPNFTIPSEGDADCAFFSWSSQMFLWLTSSVNDIEDLPKDRNFINTNSSTPYVFSSEFFYRLENGTLVPQDHTAAPSLKSLRSAKGDEDLGSIGQAGDSGVLFTHANTDVSKTSSLVYYEMLTNRSYGYVADAVINKASSPNNYSEFIDSSDESCSAILYGLNNGFVDNTGQTAASLYNIFCPNNPVKIDGIPTFPTKIPQLETAIDFLSMNMEIKTAWVDASTLKNPERYITQKGVIPVFSNVDGKNEMVHMWNKNADLALVGMHVVGSVSGHPELIWATFEHVDNAPNSTYSYTDKNGKVKSQTDTTTKANNKWLLSNGTPVSTVTEYGSSYTDPSSSVNYIKPASKTQTASVSTPSEVNRINPWGRIQGVASAKGNSAVISSNISALTQLQQFYDSLGLKNVKDPRMNYMLTGASWGVDGRFPTGDQAAQIAGTPAMANTTMETFQQTFLQKSGDNTGCFGCHGIDANENKFDVSHIFGGIKKVNK